jgi:hypothetical protein
MLSREATVAAAGAVATGCGFAAETAGFFTTFFSVVGLVGVLAVELAALLARVLDLDFAAFAGRFFAALLADVRAVFLGAFPAVFFFAVFRAFFTTRFFAAPTGRFTALLAFFFFEDFLATAKSSWSGRKVGLNE